MFLQYLLFLQEIFHLRKGQVVIILNYRVYDKHFVSTEQLGGLNLGLNLELLAKVCLELPQSWKKFTNIIHYDQNRINTTIAPLQRPKYVLLEFSPLKNLKIVNGQDCECAW